MSAGHARLPPSAAARWLNCPGSVAACADLPDEAGEAAERGALQHAHLAARLMNQPTLLLAPLTDEEAERVVRCQLWVESMVRGLGAELHVEERLHVGRAFVGDLNIFQEDAEAIEAALWGTPDGVIDAAESLTVYDAKFGFERVEAEGNPQLSLYAVGYAAARGWRWPMYRLVILQPQDSPDMRVEVLTREELRERRDSYVPRVLAALDPGAVRVPGDAQCRWCPFHAQCPEAAGEALALAQAEFPEVPDHEQLARVLDAADRVQAFIAAAREHARKVLQVGEVVPGWKLVESKRHRRWRDEKAAVETLLLFGAKKKALFETRLLSPAQAEKKLHLQARELDELAPVPPGEPTLARESDPRPALPCEFAAITDGHEGE